MRRFQVVSIDQAPPKRAYIHPKRYTRTRAHQIAARLRLCFGPDVNVAVYKTSDLKRLAL